MERVLQRKSNARLADARLAGNQHHLAFSLLRLRPTPPQQLEFFLAANQRRQACGAQRLEPAFDAARAEHAPRLACAKFAAVEQVADQAPRGLVDHDRVRAC